MSDLERRLEDLFTHDSQSRRVTAVDVPRRRTSPLRGLAFIGATALAVVALIVALNTVRDGTTPLASPTATASPVATSGAAEAVVRCGETTQFVAPTANTAGSFVISAEDRAELVTVPAGSGLAAAGGYNCVRIKPGTPSGELVEFLPMNSPDYVRPSSSPAQSTPTQVRPDAQHGLLTQRGPNLRTESSTTDMMQPRQFSEYVAAISPDGRRVAVLRNSETGQQLITLTTSRPNDVTIVLDLTGSGERAASLVWAGDGSAGVLLGVSRSRVGQVDSPAEYSVLRSVDLSTRATRDELRLTDGAYLVPVAWHPRTRVAVAVTTGAGGFASDYVLVRAGEATRTAFPRGAVVASSVRATQDGTRVLATLGAANTERVLRWWLFDRFDSQQELRPASGEAVAAASWRPGSDEFGVSVLPVIVLPNDVPRFELWTAGGARRVVSRSAGFVLFRHDGTAGITGDLQLIDLATGTLTPLPRAAPEEGPYLTLLF